MKDGWVGFWLGTNPGTGLVVVLATARLTLFTPLHNPRCTHTAFFAHAHFFCRTYFPRHSSLHGSWSSSSCALFPLALLIHVCGHLHAEQVRESSQATLIAAAMLAGIVRQSRSVSGQTAKIQMSRRQQDCTLVRLYCGQLCHTFQKKSLESVFKDQTRPHMKSCKYAWQSSATEGDDGFYRPAAISKWFRWIHFHTEGSCGPESCNFPLLRWP